MKLIKLSLIVSLASIGSTAFAEYACLTKVTNDTGLYWQPVTVSQEMTTCATAEGKPIACPTGKIMPGESVYFMVDRSKNFNDATLTATTYLNQETVVNVGTFALRISDAKKHCAANLESYWCSTNPSSGKTNCDFEWDGSSKVTLKMK